MGMTHHHPSHHNPSTHHRQPAQATRLPAGWLLGAALAGAALFAGPAAALGLSAQPAAPSCEVPEQAVTPQLPLPPAAADRLPDSQAVAGQRDVAWVWLGSPTQRYPHAALGSGVHAGSVHARVRVADGAWHTVSHTLPVHRVLEDRVPRLHDLDGDGRDELLLIEADATRGAALVVLGVRTSANGAPTLVELARGPHAGSSFRWLNPVGVADFDSDGRLDVASVTTPHIGGVLTLHHFRPPHLLPYARHLDVSNHRMGSLEQRLAVVVPVAGGRPVTVLPDMTHRALQALRWQAPGQWQALDEPLPLPARVERLLPLPGGACAVLADGRHWRIRLTP